MLLPYILLFVLPHIPQWESFSNNLRLPTEKEALYYGYISPPIWARFWPPITPICCLDYKRKKHVQTVCWKRPRHYHWTSWLSTQSNDDWAIACAFFAGTIDNHYPNDTLIHPIKIHSLTFPNVTSQTPLYEGTLVFTDGSSTKAKAGRAKTTGTAMH